MRSRIENSPYTVYECAEMGIPFVATRVGGVPDLVLPEDHGEALFEPNTDALLGRLVAALTHGVYPARPKFQANLNEQVWLNSRLTRLSVLSQPHQPEGTGETLGQAKRTHRYLAGFYYCCPTGWAKAPVSAPPRCQVGSGATGPLARVCPAALAARCWHPLTCTWAPMLQVWLNWHLDITQQEAEKTKELDEALRKEVVANAEEEEEEEEAAATPAIDSVPFVSVVMTHYNRPHLLKWAVESVELQDYPADRYELILIDDGSTQDDVAPYLDELEERFSARGWTIVRSTNMYLGAARNKAVTFR